MPFFSRQTDEPAPAPQPVEEPPKRHSSLAGSFFHRSHHDGADSPTRTSTASASSAGSAPSSPELSHPSGRRRGLFGRGGGLGDDVELDPSIVQAREHVLNAEAAEREADRVLVAARRAVEEARIKVQTLEEEAEAEAQRAKLKAFHAKDISRRGRGLGRHS